MWISRYVCLFTIYSFFGWIYECIFCTSRDKAWQNRGFLFGPVCPIYGTGAVAISLIAHMVEKRGVDFPVWQVFLIAVLGSAVLEYVTSWVLETAFHAMWWDYSDMPFNIKGRISLFTSLGFGLAGLLVVYIIAPYTEMHMNKVAPLTTELLSLCAIALFAADLTLTVTLLLHFDRVVLRFEDSFNRNMESLVKNTMERSSFIKEGITTTPKAIYDRINSMSGFVKTAVGRIHRFRYVDKNKADERNGLLSMIKRKRK